MSNDGNHSLRRFHVTRHGSGPGGDALDLFCTETAFMLDLFGQWDQTSPEHEVGEEAVLDKWDHGTVGKLIIEHAALFVAAGVEVARVIREIGQEDMADRLDRETTTIRPVVDRLYESGRGIQPMSLAITPDFIGAVEELRVALRDDLDDRGAIRALVETLAPYRSRLRSARYISRHAPARPDAAGKWGVRLPFVVRLRTAIDRVAGFPWAESSLADRKLAQRYDNDG